MFTNSEVATESYSIKQDVPLLLSKSLQNSFPGTFNKVAGRRLATLVKVRSFTDIFQGISLKLQNNCVCVCACVCVCVYVHPLWRLHLFGTAETATQQINDYVLKTLDSSAGSLHVYFGMQNLTFQLAALSCSYTRSGHSHEFTSIRLAFKT